MWKKVGICLAVGMVIAILFYLWGVVGFSKLVPGVEERGQWGDSFGVITAFFTVLAFIGLIWTILQNSKQLSQNSEQLLQNSEQIAIQQENLKVQIEELKQTRKEMEGQTEQFAVQNRTLQLQSFENSFFQLLGLYNNIVSLIEVHRADGKRWVGRESFGELFTGLMGGILRRPTSGAEKQETLKYIDETYEKFFSVFQPVIGHYFRFLYNIFKFVDESDLIEKRKKEALYRYCPHATIKR